MFRHPSPPIDEELEDKSERSQGCYPPYSHCPNALFQGPPNHGPCHHDPPHHNAPHPNRPPGPPGPFHRGPPHDEDDEGPEFPPPFPPRGMFGGFRPKMMMQKEFFTELRHFFILTILNDIPDGITGYRLQDQFQFPRGNILRLLDELVEQKYVSVEDSVSEGRAQKIFKISDAGKKYLNELKQKWAEFFSHMSDQAPMEEFGSIFMPDAGKEQLFRLIVECKDKEDAIDVIRGIRAQLTREQGRLEKRMQRLDERKAKLDEIIKLVEKMETLNTEEIKKHLDIQ